MKTFRSILLLLLPMLAIVASCEYETDDMGPSYIVGKIEDGQTKTYLEYEDSRYFPAWSSMDSIAVYAGNSTRELFVLNDGAGSRNGRFSGDADVDGNQCAVYYPYRNAQKYSNGTMTVTLPDEQSYVEGSFDRGAYPMAAFGNGPDMQFRNLCSVLRIVFENAQTLDYIDFVAASEDIYVSGNAEVKQKSGVPSLTMKNGDNAVRLWCSGTSSEYYIVVPAQVYKGGFKLDIMKADGELLTKTMKEDVTFNRSEMRTVRFSSNPGDDDNPTPDPPTPDPPVDSKYYWYWDGDEYIDDDSQYITSLEPDPNINIITVDVGAYENGQPIEWVLAGDGNVGFYPSSGTGIQTISLVVNGNPSTEPVDRTFSFMIYTKSGMKSKEFSFTQDGVFMELSTDSNVDEFDYVNETFDIITYMLPPQQSTVDFDVYTNADNLHYSGYDFKGDIYQNDVYPDLSYEWPEGEDFCEYTASYPANYNFVYEEILDMFYGEFVQMQSFKRRGLRYVMAPRVDIIVDWDELTTEQALVYDQYGEILEEEFNLIQNEIIIDNKDCFYCFAPPFAEESDWGSYVYSFNEDLDNNGKDLVIRSNVSWDVDDDLLEEWGLDCAPSGGWDIVSGETLSEKIFQIKVDEVDYTDKYESLYSDYIWRAPVKGIPSEIYRLPMLLDLDDGNGDYWPAYPGFIGQGGVPSFEIAFGADPWSGLEYGPFTVDNGKQYDMKVTYPVYVSLGMDLIDMLLISDYALSTYNSLNGDISWYDMLVYDDYIGNNFTWWINVGTGGSTIRVQNDGCLLYCNGTCLYANKYIYSEKYLSATSTKSASVNSVEAATSVGSGDKVKINKSLKAASVPSPARLDLEPKKTMVQKTRPTGQSEPVAVKNNKNITQSLKELKTF